jgi:hypothetical protein
MNQNEIQIIGTIASTAKANCQLIIKRSMLAQIIRNIEDITDVIACETNHFTASTSEVRFVSNFEGVTLCI